jgi:hypothetical protein
MPRPSYQGRHEGLPLRRTISAHSVPMEPIPYRQSEIDDLLFSASVHSVSLWFNKEFDIRLWLCEFGGNVKRLLGME